MSEESLEVISKDAETLYSNHKLHVKALGMKALGEPQTQYELTDFDKEVGISEPYEHPVDPQAAYDANIRVATEFAHDNAEQLHSLALEEDKNR